MKTRQFCRCHIMPCFDDEVLKLMHSSLYSVKIREVFIFEFGIGSSEIEF